MAMMYGLDAVDAGTPQNLKDNINKVFDELKTKYGVTDADLNSFNRDNLTSPQKIPSDCK